MKRDVDFNGRPRPAYRIAIAMAVAGSAALPLWVRAAEEPRRSPSDPHVGVETYSPQQLVKIPVSRGAMTRVVLAPDEHIETAAPGLSARCDKDEDEWCIHAERGDSQIFVRPKDEASRTNLEVRTNRRDYSFEFVVVGGNGTKSATAAGHGAGEEPFYRVTFEYPAAPTAIKAAVIAGLLGEQRAERSAAGSSPTGLAPQARLAAEPPRVHNANYSMQVLDGGQDAAPSMVFDDGRFTYLEFRGTREIPAIFYQAGGGEQTRANWHMQPPYVVVERTAREFTLRLGDAVVGIYNESFDPEGIVTPTGTTSATVVRELRDSITSEASKQ